MRGDNVILALCKGQTSGRDRGSGKEWRQRCAGETCRACGARAHATPRTALLVVALHAERVSGLAGGVATNEQVEQTVDGQAGRRVDVVDALEGVAGIRARADKACREEARVWRACARRAAARARASGAMFFYALRLMPLFAEVVVTPFHVPSS